MNKNKSARERKGHTEQWGKNRQLFPYLLMLLIAILSNSCGTSGVSATPTKAPAPSPPSPKAPASSAGPTPAATTPHQPGGSATAAPQPTTTPVSMEAKLDRQVEEQLQKLSLAEKVGQLLVVGFHGTIVPPQASDLIQQQHVGGIILFQDNITSPTQAAALTGELQREALAAAPRLPLFVTADQEGGIVVRARPGATILPGQMALGATRSAAAARLAGQITGEELQAMGINMSLSPVMDVNSNPRNPVIGVRSFGADPSLVSDLGSAMIGGYHQTGTLCVAKHFPGHGDTSVDSHLALPVVPHSLARLQQVEWPPFHAAITAGVDVVMVAHVVFPAVDPTPNLPASLSPRVMHLLRHDFHFSGIIVTDDLEQMRAISDTYTPSQAAVLAIQAGADLLLFHADNAEHVRAAQALMQAVSTGQISQGRLDDAVRHILRAKLRAHLASTAAHVASQDELARQVGSAAHQRGATQIAAQSVTLLRNSERLLPLTPTTPILVVAPTLSDIGNYEIPLPEADQETLGQAIGRTATQALQLDVGIDPTELEINRTVIQGTGLGKHGVVVVGTYQVSDHPQQSELVRRLLAAHVTVVVVALRGPYDLLDLPPVSTYLTAYSDRPVALKQISAVLFGQEQPQGALPVSLAPLYALGAGLKSLNG